MIKIKRRATNTRQKIIGAQIRTPMEETTKLYANLPFSFSIFDHFFFFWCVWGTWNSAFKRFIIVKWNFERIGLVRRIETGTQRMSKEKKVFIKKGLRVNEKRKFKNEPFHRVFFYLALNRQKHFCVCFRAIYARLCFAESKRKLVVEDIEPYSFVLIWFHSMIFYPYFSFLRFFRHSPVPRVFLTFFSPLKCALMWIGLHLRLSFFFLSFFRQHFSTEIFMGEHVFISLKCVRIDTYWF